MDNRDIEVELTHQLGELVMQRLDQHADKGRLGWQFRPFNDLMDDLREEAAELSGAVSIMEAVGTVPGGSTIYQHYREEAIAECGDLAALAMMVADRLRAFNVEVTSE